MQTKYTFACIAFFWIGALQSRIACPFALEELKYNKLP